MANKKDFYEVLGVQKGATQAEIKKAYRQMAKKHHPDLNQGDKASEAKFKEANEAYEILNDKEKKAKYDQYGHAGVDPSYGGGGFGGGAYSGGFSGGGGSANGGFGFDDLGDIFNMFTGGSGYSSGGRRKAGPQKGQDISYELNLDFKEAAFGAKKELNIQRNEVCTECKGTGAKAGSAVETCKACSGSGEIRFAQNSIFGRTISVRPCEECAGEGKKVKDPCTSCAGKTFVRKNRKITVDIPAGVDTGMVMPLKGEGNSGAKGGPAGDVNIHFKVKPSKIFRRKDMDVYEEVLISISQASLGAEIDVPTLEGETKHTISEGTQTGTTFKLKSKGIPSVRYANQRGDLYFTVKVDVPKKLTDQQKDILRNFALTLGETVDDKSFFGKVKDAFAK